MSRDNDAKMSMCGGQRYLLHGTRVCAQSEDVRSRTAPHRPVHALRTQALCVIHISLRRLRLSARHALRHTDQSLNPLPDKETAKARSPHAHGQQLLASRSPRHRTARRTHSVTKITPALRLSHGTCTASADPSTDLLSLSSQAKRRHAAWLNGRQIYPTNTEVPHTIDSHRAWR